MRRNQSPFHHVVYFAIYGSLITAHAVEYPRGKQPIFFCLLLLTQICNMQHCGSAHISDFSSLRCQKAHEMTPAI